jgi:DNA-binding CsgD family transcriptional regulator
VVVSVRSGVPCPDAVTTLWKDGFLDRVDLAPFDRATTAVVAEAVLGGPLAGPSTDLLWQWTGGNALLLVELVRHGRRRGHLARTDGRWWWRAPLDVPPVLEELLEGQLDQLDADARDALAAVVLGEPLPVASLRRVVPASALAALEDADLVRPEDASGRVVLRTVHPLLSAAVRRRLGAVRLGRIAARLLAAEGAPAGGTTDVVRRATWQLVAVGPVDVGLLLRASSLVRPVDPALAVRLAERARAETRDATSAVALADALVERCDPVRARSVLEAARAEAEDPGDALRLDVSLAGLRVWAERDPPGGYAELLRLGESTPAGTGAPGVRGPLDDVRDDVAALAALALLFGARPREALDAADRLLARGGTGDAAVRAELVRVTGLTLVGRTAEAVVAGESLVTRLGAAPSALPYAAGMAEAALSLARLWRSPVDDVPLTDPATGRWPSTAGTELVGLQPVPWSLLDGYVRRVAGDRTAAADRLAEALVQQSGGEGLFRSEAAAWLAITLADDGRPDDAATVLDEHPPDGVAIVPGLAPWATAALHAARGELPAAVEWIGAAVAAARAAGAALVELGYLVYAAELHGVGGPLVVGERLAELSDAVDAPRLVASAGGVLALARRAGEDIDPARLHDLAAQLEAYGLLRQALGLVEAALAGNRQGRDRARLRQWQARLRRDLGEGVTGLPAGLTRREHEIAELAARGLPDRDIADRLVVSVRTVESHLGRVYRKLGVSSRRDLPGALAAAAGPGRGPR